MPLTVIWRLLFSAPPRSGAPNKPGIGLVGWVSPWCDFAFQFYCNVGDC